MIDPTRIDPTRIDPNLIDPNLIDPNRIDPNLIGSTEQPGPVSLDAIPIWAEVGDELTPGRAAPRPAPRPTRVSAGDLTNFGVYAADRVQPADYQRAPAVEWSVVVELRRRASAAITESTLR